MLILSIDTTANTASAALVKDGGVLSLFTVNGTLTHSETMLPMIENMLSYSGTSLDSVDAFAVSEGPGSFTGVRIGVSLIKGLAFAGGKPCIGVSALEALSRNLDGIGGWVIPVMDARRSQVYTAIFRDGERLSEDMLIPLTELKERLAALGADNIRFVGDGYQLARGFFADSGINVLETPAQLIPHNAVSVALAAETAGKKTDRELSPRYLRASQAERERIERLEQEKSQSN